MRLIRRRRLPSPKFGPFPWPGAAPLALAYITEDTTAGAICTTPSGAPTAGALILLFNCGRRVGSLPATDPPVDSLGQTTFGLAINVSHSPAVDPYQRGRIQRGFATTADARTWTAGLSNANSTILAVYQVVGGGLPTNMASGTASITGDPTSVLPSAPAANSLVVAFAVFEGTDGAFAAPTGFTMDRTPIISGTTQRLAIATRIGGDGVANWSSSNVNSQCGICEIPRA